MGTATFFGDNPGYCADKAPKAEEHRRFGRRRYCWQSRVVDSRETFQLRNSETSPILHSGVPTHLLATFGR